MVFVPLRCPTRPFPLLYRALGSAVLVALLLGGTPATAQVPLQLLQRVDRPDQNPAEGRPLPEGTTVIVLRYPAERPRTLENAGMPRKELARLVLTRLRSRDTTIQLDDEGKTPGRYPPTPRSEQIYYVLARTPADSLFESYVNTGDGFVPGFDAVQSGRMTMGPVVGEARRRYEAVFRLSQEASATADTAQTPPKTSAKTRAPDSTAEQTAGPKSNEAVSASSDETGLHPVWWLLLGGLAGGLIGGGVTWFVLSSRVKRAEETKDQLLRRLRKRKGKEFRAATGTALSPPPEDPEESSLEVPPAEKQPLRKENERLREENASLKREIEEIRRYLQSLQTEAD